MSHYQLYFHQANQISLSHFRTIRQTVNGWRAWEGEEWYDDHEVNSIWFGVPVAPKYLLLWNRPLCKIEVKRFAKNSECRFVVTKEYWHKSWDKFSVYALFEAPCYGKSTKVDQGLIFELTKFSSRFWVSKNAFKNHASGSGHLNFSSEIHLVFFAERTSRKWGSAASLLCANVYESMENEIVAHINLSEHVLVYFADR